MRRGTVRAPRKVKAHLRHFVAESGGDFLATVRTTKIGPPLIFDRLWRKRGVDAVLGELLQARKFEFAVERAGCLTAPVKTASRWWRLA